jgi:hypothetical protein
MTVTLTASYKEFLTADTVEKIDELIDENYALDDMLEFIDAHSEADFVSYYEEYVTAGESVGYDVADAFVEEFGIDCIESCSEAYQGEYSSTSDFAEEFYSEMYSIPDAIVVDWEATWESMLRYDYAYVDGFVFNKNF